jgi:predicted phosphoadenosine phosphosulfate sulfurtransferase
MASKAVSDMVIKKKVEPTWKSNCVSLLHYRQTCYQLSYHDSLSLTPFMRLTK